MNTRLLQTIAEAEAIYIAKADELEQLRLRVERENAMMGNNFGTTRLVSAHNVRGWLKNVKHLMGRHRKHGNHALAYYKKQQITYNPLYLDRCAVDGWDLVTNTVRHELGHLFDYYFLRRHGHEWTWRAIGTIVGYSHLFRNSDEQKRASDHFARPMEVAADSAPLATVDTTPVISNISTIEKPVETVWMICNTWPEKSRKELLALCAQAGINPNTAATQYAAWNRRQKSWGLR